MKRPIKKTTVISLLVVLALISILAPRFYSKRPLSDSKIITIKGQIKGDLTTVTDSYRYKGLT